METADKAKVVIHVEGGLVQQVIADRDIEVLVVDYDNEEVEQAEDEESGDEWKPDRTWGKPDCIDAETIQAWAEAREKER